MKTSSTKIKEEQQLELYAMYENRLVSTQMFNEFCVDMIEGARAPNPQLIRTIPAMPRDKALMSTNNFIMKGQGYGVA